MAFPSAPHHRNSPCCPCLPAQHPPHPQLTEYEENAHGEQDHGEHQPPDPQALVIWEGETQGSFLRGSGKAAAPLLPLAHTLPPPCPAMLTHHS